MSRMQPNHQMMDEDQFVSQFGPKPNRLNSAAGFDFGDGGCLFETYGHEWQYVRAAEPAAVWTVIEGDDALVIESGLHWVNRLGFILTDRPVPPGMVITVMLEGL
jgi:hypothetical protein